MQRVPKTLEAHTMYLDALVGVIVLYGKGLLVASAGCEFLKMQTKRIKNA